MEDNQHQSTPGFADKVSFRHDAKMVVMALLLEEWNIIPYHPPGSKQTYLGHAHHHYTISPDGIEKCATDVKRLRCLLS